MLENIVIIILAGISKCCPRHAIIATNTLRLDISVMMEEVIGREAGSIYWHTPCVLWHFIVSITEKLSEVTREHEVLIIQLVTSLYID